MKNQKITGAATIALSLMFTGAVYATNNYSAINYPNSNVESQLDGNDGIITNTLLGSQSATGNSAHVSTIERMNDNTNYITRRTEKTIVTTKAPASTNDTNYRKTTTTTTHKVVTSNTVAADNTGRNKRDRNDANLTAEDQALGSRSDVETTRLIRQQIVKDDNLSVNAKNVKIITLNNVVTLRGPVNSQSEKNRIAQAAQSVARSFQVQNELEVIRK